MPNEKNVGALADALVQAVAGVPLDALPERAFFTQPRENYLRLAERLAALGVLAVKTLTPDQVYELGFGWAWPTPGDEDGTKAKQDLRDELVEQLVDFASGGDDYEDVERHAKEEPW